MVSPATSNSHVFNLKTNKFNGPQAEKQSSLVLLDQFDALNETFLNNCLLFEDKTANLQGREVVIAGFDYKPYFVINYVLRENNSFDLAYGDSAKGAVQIDGTEARVVTTFCEIYNCKVVIDSCTYTNSTANFLNLNANFSISFTPAEATDWGEVYPNLTGDFSLGMVSKDIVDISIGAMYSW